MLKNHLVTILLICCFLPVSIADAQSVIIIDAADELSNDIKKMQGFLHGGPMNLDSSRVADLQPQFWRLGAYWYDGSGYEDAEKFNPQFTISINDLYMITNGIIDQSMSKPWEDNWISWDAIVNEAVTQLFINEKPVAYWDVFNEPDNFWTGTYEQWIEMYRRTDSIIHGITPDAKITGPEFGFAECDFSAASIMQFLDSLYYYDVVVESISWHEFCNPHDMIAHVNLVRDSLALRPWANAIDIHITEYAGPSNHIIPGWNVGWLYYAEQAQLNWFTHACWNESDGVNNWSDCQKGLNGLFMSDNSTPQPNYWVHRAYAALPESRIACTPLQEKTIALAGKDDISETLIILTGRYDNPNLGAHNANENLEIIINNYPYCNDCNKGVFIQRIPSNNVAHSVALPAPTSYFEGEITFESGTGTLVIPEFVDGDAFIIYINAETSAILDVNTEKQSSQINVFPNPAETDITISCNRLIQHGICKIFDVTGKPMQTISFSGSQLQLNTRHLAPGLYLVYLTEYGTTIGMSKIVVVK